MTLEIRNYQDPDRGSLYEICLLTGQHGQDASATSTHPELLGDTFAIPYVNRDPSLCLILADTQGPCGYILGTNDSLAFAAWFNRIWLPVVREKYGELTARAGASDGWLFELIRNDVEVPAWAAEYPAHLHIDLLPRAQGRGWGRRMFGAWKQLAAGRGAPALHLGVSTANHGAIAFYECMGMERIAATPWAWIYGQRLDRLA